jgi:hypothetical protein
MGWIKERQEEGSAFGHQYKKKNKKNSESYFIHAPGIHPPAPFG